MILTILIILIIIFAILFIPFLLALFKKRRSRRCRSSYDEWQFLDKVVYINLADRTDRREMIENELFSHIPREKVIRLNAIRDTPGHVGCSQSHIKALEMAIQEGWRNVLIVEDDAMFNKYEKGYPCIERLIHEHPDFDVISLGNTASQFDRATNRLYSGQTTTAYLVNQHYYPRLLANYKEGLSKLWVTKTMTDPIERHHIENQYCVDQYWKRLQKVDQWYLVNPALMIQRPDKSSILQTEVDYTSYFNE